MGHPNVAQNLLTPNFPRASKQPSKPTPVRESGPARIAERIPPALHTKLNSSAHRADRASSRSATTPARVVVMLIMIASLPSLVFGALLWFGLVKLDFPTIPTLGDSAGSVVRSASVAGGLLQDQSSPSVVSPQVLGVPDVVDARVGESTPLTLALGGTEGLPTGSFFSIRGLPSGASLSSGRPYGDEDWSLTLEEVDGLKVVLPETAEAETQLRIALLSPGGEEIASAEMRLRASPVQSPGATSEVHAEKDVSKFGTSEGVRPFVRHGPDSLDFDFALTARSSTVPPTAVVNDHNGATADATAKPKSQDDDPNAWVLLSAFVNLREGPSSSERIISVLDKGKKLRVVRRQRSWLEVTDSESKQSGWIYARYAYSATSSRQAMKKSRPSRLSSSASAQEPEPAFWTRLGSWMTGR